MDRLESLGILKQLAEGMESEGQPPVGADDILRKVKSQETWRTNYTRSANTRVGQVVVGD